MMIMMLVMVMIIFIIIIIIIIIMYMKQYLNLVESLCLSPLSPFRSNLRNCFSAWRSFVQAQVTAARACSWRISKTRVAQIGMFRSSLWQKKSKSETVRYATMHCYALSFALLCIYTPLGTDASTVSELEGTLQAPKPESLHKVHLRPLQHLQDWCNITTSSRLM